MSAQLKNSILLVDDEPQVLIALEDLLADEFTVYKSESAERALELVARDPEIAVVITDQRMPRMNGDELTVRLRKASQAQRILVTGFADLSAVVRAINDGKIFAYVTKPWNPEDLRVKVHSAVEHFRLTRELTNERRLLHDLMDNIPDGIYFKDNDLRFQRVNRAFAELTQAPDCDHLIGKTAEEAFGESASRLDEERMLRDGRPVLDLLRRHAASGVSRWLSETKAPIRDGGSRILGIVGITRDVTDRVSIEHALRESEARLRDQSRVLNSILDGMAEGVIVADCEGRFILFNGHAESMLGKGPKGQSAFDWARSCDFYQADKTTRVNAHDNPLLRAISGEEAQEVELFITSERVNGTVVAASATVLRDDAGGVAGGILVLRDVSAHKELERQLILAQRMEAIGQLAGGVAHDFNNLLLVIESYADFVRQSLPEGDERRDDLQQVLLAGRRAAGLTRQLLAFSSRQMVQRQIISLNECVSSILKMLGRIIGENIELVLDLSPDLEPVFGDVSQIEQIIMNLAVNSRDAMPSGGRLAIETRNVVLGEREVLAHPGLRAGRFTLLEMRDTGMGMDEATRRRIFEPFFTTKEPGKGTGLGLATLYGIVRQSGGHVVVESELGKGASFKVYLPCADEAHARPQRAPSGPPVKGGGTILLVEDEEAVRLATARMLRKQGYTVLVASVPSDARRLCREHGRGIDLLLTDIVMPEVSGPKLAQELVAHVPDLRILYMSGYAAGNAQEDLLAVQDHYIEKPFTQTTLAAKVQQALGLAAVADRAP